MARSRKTGLARLAGLAGCGLLVLAAAAEHIGWRRQSERLAGVLEQAAAPEEVVLDTRREADPVGARLRAARALLALEIDAQGAPDRSGPERRERALAGIPNLDRARDLAREALATRPAAWQGHLVVGATRFLEWSRTADPRLATERDAWEQPLLRAFELAPGQREPARFLAAAYLNEWSRRNDSERSAALPIIRRALADPRALDALLPTWLRLAPSLGTALSLLPDTVDAWSHLARLFAARDDWERYCLARDRRELAQIESFSAAIELARTLTRSGDVGRARSRLLTVMRSLPVRGPYDSILTEALRTLPPGPLPPESAEGLATWLAWARERCLQGSCRLPPDVVARIAGLAAVQGSARRAEAALLAEDLAAAELLERRAALPLSDDWSVYYLLKATLLARLGLEREAEDALDLVSPEWRRRPEFSAARAAVRRAPGVTELARRTQPSGPEWSESRRRWRAGLGHAAPGSTVALQLTPSGKAGAAAEILWNGDLAGCLAVSGAARPTLQPTSWLAVNWLDVQPLENRTLQLGAVDVRPPA